MSKGEQTNLIIKLINTELGVCTLGIFAILILEFFAIARGIDGTMFGAAIAGIGGIIGWVAKMQHYRRRDGKN